MRAPYVTILMPVYNGQRYLDEAIASVLEQDYGDFEFVIVDDGSTDATPAMLEAWASRDARIRLLRAPRNEGVPAALNRGLAIARGRYVARQDADDLCLPGRLAKQVETLDRDASIVLVSAGYELMDTRGRSRGLEMRVGAPQTIAYLLNFSNAIGGHGQVMFRRELTSSLGGYSIQHMLTEDYELWSRLREHGRIVVLPIVGMRHRLHDERVSIVMNDLQLRRSLLVSRDNMMRFLNRELSDREFDAVASVWRQLDRRGAAKDAQRLFVETYRAFCAIDDDRRHRRQIRIMKARVWFLSAAMHAKRGSLAEVLPYLAYSLRWHPLGFVQGALMVMQRAWRFALRTAGIPSPARRPAHRENARA